MGHRRLQWCYGLPMVHTALLKGFWFSKESPPFKWSISASSNKAEHLPAGSAHVIWSYNHNGCEQNSGNSLWETISYTLKHGQNHGLVHFQRPSCLADIFLNDLCAVRQGTVTELISDWFK